MSASTADRARPERAEVVFRKAWEPSDNHAAFEQAPRNAAPHWRSARLGGPTELPSVETVKAEIADCMTDKIREFTEQAERDMQQHSAFIDFRKAEVVGQHIEERRALAETQEKRWQAENPGARGCVCRRGFGHLASPDRPLCQVKARNRARNA